MKKLINKYGAKVFFILFLYGEVFGIFHSINNHSKGDIALSLIIPPLAWYHSIEMYSHNPYSYVKASSGLTNDIQTCIRYIDQLSGETHFPYNLLGEMVVFSGKLNSYPECQKDYIKEGVKQYINCRNSINLDFVNTLNNYNTTLDINSLYSSGTIILQQNLEKYRLEEKCFKPLPWAKDINEEIVFKVRETKATTERNRIKSYYVTILGMKTRKWNKDSKMIYGILFNEKI